MSLLLLQNDARQVPLRDGSVHCCVTSPPYYSLRDYGEQNQIGMEKLHDCLGWATGSRCGSCFLCSLVAVFQECYRILRNDGVMFVIIGDSYNAAGRVGHGTHQGMKQGTNRASAAKQDVCRPSAATLKPKDLCGIPQRLALALQSNGWYWRSEITWCKTAPMPESVLDRPTSATEKVLLFAKQERYFWNQEAVREPAVSVGKRSEGGGAYTSEAIQGHNKEGLRALGEHPVAATRNCWNYWLIGTEPTSHQHYATFPTALVSRCIRAGSPEACCGSCGKGWQRGITVTGEWRAQHDRTGKHDGIIYRRNPGGGLVGPNTNRERSVGDLHPTCSCVATPVPSLVYDPFSGSGTVPLVARHLGRHGIGSDLSWSYLQIARERLGFTDLALWEGTQLLHQDPVSVEGLPLFQGLAE